MNKILYLVFITLYVLNIAGCTFLYGAPCSEINTAYLEPSQWRLPPSYEIKCIDVTNAKKIFSSPRILIKYVDSFKNVSTADTFYANHTNLIRFPTKVLKQLPHIETIDLNGNYIKKVPRKLFKITPRLNKLLLEGNNVQIPKKSPLTSSPTLKTLMLSNNGIEVLYKYTFKKLPKLEVLYLDGNKLRSIESILGVMPNLQYLHLGRNYLTKIPERRLVSGVLKYYITKNQLS